MVAGDYYFDHRQFDREHWAGGERLYNTSSTDASNVLRGVFEDFAQSGGLSMLSGLQQQVMPYVQSPALLDSLPSGLNMISRNGLGNIGRMILGNAGPLLGSLAEQYGIGSFVPQLAQPGELPPYDMQESERDDETAPYYAPSFAPQATAAPYLPEPPNIEVPRYIGLPADLVKSTDDEPFVDPDEIPRADVPADQQIPAQPPAPTQAEYAEAQDARQLLGQLQDLRQQYDFGRYLPIRRDHAMKLMIFLPAEQKRLFTDMFDKISRDGRTLSREDIDAYSMKYSGHGFFGNA